ncbi:MAG: 5-(carboxyamino)imidazole ribonucleotide synthase [Saprospiraceae bacterium]|nr:5-(carboxyamino)imidazole ribonucleotide synthase [Saprospiraceae bacterium]
MIERIHNKKVGILGGGQLGRMLAQATIPYAIELHFLDQDASFPAGEVSGHFHRGSFKDYEDVLHFGRQMDIITIEIENVNVEALKQLESEGKKVFPQAHVIERIKDKGLQKQFYRAQGFETSAFILINDKQEILDKISDGTLSLPFVQKSRTAGYDGKGVAIIRDEKSLDMLMDTPSVIESLVDIQKELAITVAKNERGDVITYPVVEMAFNASGNLLDYLLSPAEVTPEIQDKCRSIAKKLIDALDMVGILAVELFYTKSGEIIINEIAPRTHNSGHHTINASNYSQFDVHLRSITNMPLKAIRQDNVALMINLLGETGHTGEVYYEGFDELVAMDNVYVHLYGKKITKPLRKMGHVNIIAEDKQSALDKMAIIKSTLKVKT